MLLLLVTFQCTTCLEQLTGWTEVSGIFGVINLLLIININNYKLYLLKLLFISSLPMCK